MAQLGYLQSSFELLKKIGTTGAISESSRFVEDEITAYISPIKPQTIVEFGAGHGNITRKILSKMHPHSKLISFEIESEFIKTLKRELQDLRVSFVEASAETVLQHVQMGQIDVVVSSLPLTIIPAEIVKNILIETQKALAPNGTYSQLLYTPQPLKFKKYFPIQRVKITLNFPLAFIHHNYMYKTKREGVDKQNTISL